MKLIVAIIYLNMTKGLLTVKMKELVCKIQPFDLTQIVFLVEDNKEKQVFKIKTADFAKECYQLWSTYMVDIINIKGHRKFSMGLKDKIEKIAKEAYSKSGIKIIITK